MKLTRGACDFENDVLDALGRGYIGPALMEHVHSCLPCGELHQIAGALLNERVAAMSEAAVPSAASMWWRLQLRHRQEAQARGRRSLLIGQAVTLLLAIGFIASFFGTDMTATFRNVFATVRFNTPLFIALVSFLVALPVAGLVAIRQK